MRDELADRQIVTLEAEGAGGRRLRVPEADQTSTPATRQLGLPTTMMLR